MLKKIFWLVLILVLIVWIGVGIYFLRNSAPKTFPASPKTTSTSPSQPTESPDFESLDKIHFIVGKFKDWEEIEDSEDKYILLSKPETKRNYPKIKVVLELSNSYENYDFWEGMTAFSVEKSEEEYDDLGYFRDFTSEEVDKLIKKGDFIKVVFERESIIEKFEENSEDLGVKDLKHTTDDYLALSLSIKRAEGKTAVEKELGREIQGL